MRNEGVVRAVSTKVAQDDTRRAPGILGIFRAT